MNALQRHARALADPARARLAARYFKTGPGEYGAGDVFLGLTVPQVRSLAAEGRDAEERTLLQLLASRYHEERLLALVILVGRARRADERGRRRIARLYLAHLGAVNNWDLVDASAPGILGPLWAGRRAPARDRLSRSPDLWRRRVAVLGTFYEVGQGRFAAALRLAACLLDDEEDLIHKAVGWMLREVGKRDAAVLRRFLREHAARMPRTALRYAIERLPERERKAWLAAPRARR